MKFKVWDIASRRWVKDDTALRCDGLLLIDNGFEWVSPADPDRFVVCLYTGLKDKNGIEIYEGDIVVIPGEYIWFDGDNPNYRGVVEWVYSQWQVIAHCVNPDKSGISNGINYGFNDNGVDENENSEWLILGNIYETPELLKTA